MSAEDKVSFAGCGPAAWPGAEGVCERQGRDGGEPGPLWLWGPQPNPPLPPSRLEKESVWGSLSCLN